MSAGFVCGGEGRNTVCHFKVKVMSSWSWLAYQCGGGTENSLDLVARQVSMSGPGPGRSQVLSMFLLFFSLLTAFLSQAPLFIPTLSNHAWKPGCIGSAILCFGTSQL